MQWKWGFWAYLIQIWVKIGQKWVKNPKNGSKTPKSRGRGPGGAGGGGPQPFEEIGISVNFGCRMSLRGGGFSSDPGPPPEIGFWPFFDLFEVVFRWKTYLTLDKRNKRHMLPKTAQKKERREAIKASHGILPGHICKIWPFRARSWQTWPSKTPLSLVFGWLTRPPYWRYNRSPRWPTRAGHPRRALRKTGRGGGSLLKKLEFR